MMSFVIAAAVAALDQAAKYMVVRNIVPGRIIQLADFFNLTHTRNTGAVWGFLQHQNAPLVALSVAVLAAIAVFYKWLAGPSRAARVALGLMIGGISGNLADRIRLGWVVDFLDFSVNNWHWPTFNVADIAICLGVFLYAVFSFHAAPPGPGGRAKGGNGPE